MTKSKSDKLLNSRKKKYYPKKKHKTTKRAKAEPLKPKFKETQSVEEIGMKLSRKIASANPKSLKDYLNLLSKSKVKRSGTVPGYCFEIFALHVLKQKTEIKEVYMVIDAPTHLKKLLPDVDHGIDLIAVDTNDKVIGIQVKLRRGSEYIPKRMAGRQSSGYQVLNYAADKIANMLGHRRIDSFIIFSTANKVDDVVYDIAGNSFTTFLKRELDKLTKSEWEVINRSILGQLEPKSLGHLIQLTEKQLKVIKAASTISGQTISDYIISSAISKATKDVIDSVELDSILNKAKN